MKEPIPVPKAQAPDLGQVLAELQAQLVALTERLDRLEARAASAPAAAPPPVRMPEPSAPAPARKEEHAAPSVSEEEILAVSAALAAYLGVRLRIRQIRLLSSPAWAQQGRVSIQASHRLHN
jgi:methylmalonyl-CoA carboxyltransferase large subunit